MYTLSLQKLVVGSLVILFIGAGSSLLTIKLVSPVEDVEKGIPHIDDPKHPVVDGVKMTTKQFKGKHCQSLASKKSETCHAIDKANVRTGLGWMPSFGEHVQKKEWWKK